MTVTSGVLRTTGASGSLDPVSTVAVARRVAQELAGRTHRTGAAVRASFVALPPNNTARADAAPAASEPTVASLLRGGRGGEVKLKVELSALWIAVSEPFDVTLAARVWAKLIGLPDPDGRGAHRVSSAIRQLVKNNLLTQDGGAGTARKIELLDESGNGAPYTPPGGRIGELRAAGENFAEHRYFRVPTELWTHGWLAILNGPALAMLLVLLQLASGRSTADLWFSPAVADRRFGLSEETRRRGLTQLEELELITTARRPVNSSSLDVPRFRNTYTLNLERLRRTTPMSYRIQVSHLADALDDQPYLVDENDHDDLVRLLTEIDKVPDPKHRTSIVWGTAERTLIKVPLRGWELRAAQPLTPIPGTS